MFTFSRKWNHVNEQVLATKIPINRDPEPRQLLVVKRLEMYRTSTDSRLSKLFIISGKVRSKEKTYRWMSV